MSPLFPEFKLIEFSDQKVISSFSEQFEPYSDYNFISLWSYDTENSYRFSFLNDNLVVRFLDYLTLQPFYSFLGTNKPVETIMALLEVSRKDNLEPVLHLVPEVSIQGIQHTTRDYVIELDDTNHDYILSVNELSKLSGNKFGPKRNFVNRFVRLYPGCVAVEIDLNDIQIKENILAVFYTWEKRKQALRQDTVIELTAIERLLLRSQDLSIHAVGLYDGNRMIGFSLNEIIPNNYAIIHFEKADKDYVGSFQFLKQQTALFLEKRGVTAINYEQDFGTEGLRKAKRSYHPIRFLNKYTVTGR